MFESMPNFKLEPFKPLAFGQFYNATRYYSYTLQRPYFYQKSSALESQNIQQSTAHQIPTSGGNGDDDKTQFQLQSGKAIDALQREWPNYFKNGLSDYSIYSKSVLLAEPYHIKFYVKGIQLYKYFMKGFRHGMNWYYGDLKFNIRSISRPNEREVLMRWQVEGTPRGSIEKMWFQGIFKTLLIAKDETEFIEKSVYEGIFRFRFNAQGFIAEHHVENIIPAPKKFVMLNIVSWWQRGKIAGELELNSTTSNS
jgi:hypothetical protein